MTLEERPLVKYILGMDCSFALVLFPWYWRKTDSNRLRRFVHRRRWKQTKKLWPKISLTIKALAWPLIAVSQMIILCLINTKGVKRVSGRGIVKQGSDLLYHSLWKGFPPQCYFDQRLYFCQLSHILDDFLPVNVYGDLIDMVNRLRYARIVDDKVLCSRYCRKWNLPTATAIASFQKGKVEDNQEDFSFPKTDIYFKPADGLKGQGIERWDYKTDSDSWTFEDQNVTEVALKTHFKEASKSGDYILEEAAFNHPLLEDFSTGALITFRVMSIIGLDKEVEIVGCTAIIPFGNTPANHGSYGGMLTQLNLETHRFGAVVKRLPELQKMSHQPETGDKIEGFYFEEWPLLKDLTEKAHRAFHHTFCIGWDLALTRNGPQIIEGNTRGGLLPGIILGKTNFCRRHLELQEKIKAEGEILGSLV